MLNVTEYGTTTGRPDLLIVHGLFGSARNWGAIAVRLSVERRVIAVDQRNHGQSPWFDSHSYPDMASDLGEVAASLPAPPDLLGHSMGGKAAMVLALTRPELVNRLIVVDIAPVAYDHSQMQHIEAMRAVDLSTIGRRSDAEAQLARTIADTMLVSFFAQSLDLKNKRWRLNLDVLARDMPEILGFPEIEGRFDGDTLFLSGARSDYVKPDHRDRIKALFPKARFARIPGAGHWVHAERPREFEAAVRTWLG